MAFNFQWPVFEEHFIEKAKSLLTGALNKGEKPQNIVDDIVVTELDMGTTVRLIALFHRKTF
jgi:distribution and morphology protein 34